LGLKNHEVVYKLRDEIFRAMIMIWLKITIMAMFLGELQLLSTELADIFSVLETQTDLEPCSPQQVVIERLDSELNRWIERHNRLIG